MRFFFLLGWFHEPEDVGLVRPAIHVPVVVADLHAITVNGADQVHEELAFDSYEDDVAYGELTVNRCDVDRLPTLDEWKHGVSTFLVLRDGFSC